MRDKAATELCLSSPVGSEPYDRLGDRVKIQVSPIPSQIAGGKIPTFQIRMSFDGNPLEPLEKWPLDDEEEFEVTRMTDQSFVAAWCRTGPQPDDHDRFSSDRIPRVSPVLASSDFGLEDEADTGVPGRYQLKIVGKSLIRVSPNDVRVAIRILEFEIELDASPTPPTLPTRADGWAISYEIATQGILEHVAAGGNLGAAGSISIPYDVTNPLKTVTQQRMISTDVTTGKIYVGTGNSIAIFSPDSGPQIFDSLANIPLQGISALSLDEGRQHLWISIGHTLYAIDLRENSVIRTIATTVKDLAADPLTGGVWTFAKGNSNRPHLQRFSLDGTNDLSVAEVFDASAPIPRNPRASIKCTPTGEFVGNAIVGTHPSLVKVNSAGEITAKSTSPDSSVTEPIEIAVHPSTGQVWTINNFGNRGGITWYDADLRRSGRYPFKGVTSEGEIQQFWSIDINSETGDLWVMGGLQVRDPITGEFIPRMLILKRSESGAWSTVAGVTNRRSPFVRTF